ncbi:MAG: GNAT family N-acetyltransferase [Gammaproteobacteria bacterium]|nr:MAG: GNAT family N-acetyltransferase [Gammaproteobacteria bacterium]
MIIRQALVQDAAELTEFNISMARETEGIELIPEVIGAGVRAMIDNPQRGFYLVVELDNGIQASLMVTTEWSDWRNGMFWWIQSVYVRPQYRRQGLYRVLYERVRELAEQEPSVCGFRLYVERDNSVAQKTYSALGMNQTEYRIYEELIPNLEYRKNQ